MDTVAFIVGDSFLYWSSIVYALAAATAACFFLAFYLGRSESVAAGFAAVPLSIVLGLLLARLLHWYSRSDSYDGFLAAMTDFHSGGYALMGVFAGCLLAAALLRLIRIHRDLPTMLDCMALAGTAGIAVGRLASLFNASDRGQILASLRFLPIAYPVTNVVSGATEYRLATFMLQAMVALLLFIGLTVFFSRGKRSVPAGDTCLVFLLIYCASQILLDSTRYDSLFFRSNGFVSIVQVFSALTLVLVIVLFSRRMVRAQGLRWWSVVLWLLEIACIGGGGYMEYYVQRHGDQALFAYSVMGACLTGVVMLTLLIRGLAVSQKQKKR